MKETVALVLTVVVLTVVSLVWWRLESLPMPRQLSGQWVQEGNIRTERFVDESLDMWSLRHDEAVRRMNQ